MTNGCPYCQGALTSGHEIKVYKCFQCARMYRVEGGYLKLWPYREYEHLPHRNTLVLRGGIQITLDGRGRVSDEDFLGILLCSLTICMVCLMWQEYNSHQITNLT